MKKGFPAPPLPLPLPLLAAAANCSRAIVSFASPKS
jgi:hypothetical protein